MTVADLIRELQSMPSSAPVVAVQRKDGRVSDGEIVQKAREVMEVRYTGRVVAVLGLGLTNDGMLRNN